MSAVTLVNIVLAAILLEALVLAWTLRHRPAPVRNGVLVTLAAGATLVLTLRAVLGGASPLVLALCLFVALVTHLADLYLRLIRSP